MSATAEASTEEKHATYIFPGLHGCLTAQNPEGRSHAFAYVDNAEICYGVQHQPRGAANAVALYMRHSLMHRDVSMQSPVGVGRRTCVCCAADFKFSLKDAKPYDATDMMKQHNSAMVCITCTTMTLDNDGQNFFVCSECTRLTQEALVEAKKCIRGAFCISNTIHLKDMLAFYLFLRMIDVSIARAPSPSRFQYYSLSRYCRIGRLRRGSFHCR
jgi:hypothetical protein